MFGDVAEKVLLLRFYRRREESRTPRYSYDEPRVVGGY